MRTHKKGNFGAYIFKYYLSEWLTYSAHDISDGKILRWRPTNKTINDLQQYYGMAIINYTSKLDRMWKVVWTTYFHKVSNDCQPQHSLCPPGPETWCGFKAAGESFEHKSSITKAVMETIIPIHGDLSHPHLLRKCLHKVSLATQNPNKSFNIIWTRVPFVFHRGVFQYDCCICHA